jgi:hypothetical protein
MHDGASRFFLIHCGARAGFAPAAGAKAEHAEVKRLFRDFRVPATFGTNVAAMHHMNKRIRGLYPIVAGLLAAVAVPAAGASDLLLEVAAWIGESHIAEVVVAANALTIVP